MAAASSSDPPPPASASRLAPGFRFHPTDEELVSYYLKRKVCGRPHRVDAVAEVDIYKCEPWDLPGLSRIRTRDLEWYFFSPLDRKYSNRSRTNRATPQGYWKTTGKDRPVRRGPRVVGMKKTLVFHAGRAPRGTRTNWVMHEYRLEDEQLTQAGVSQDAYVICRIFQKSGAGPQNGAQYGAPFLEEEWEAEEADGVVLMPDGGADEFNEAAELDYLHFSDFLQNEDLENQHVDASNFVPDVDRKDNSSFPENATVFQDEILDDPSFTDMVEYIDETGQQSSPAPIEGMEKKTVMEDCTHNPSRPNVKDEYVELNDLADTANVVHPYSEESVGYPIRNFHAQNMDGAGENSNLQKMLDVEEFFDAVSQNTEAEQSKSLRMAPLEDNVYSQQNDLNSVSGGCSSGQQLQDKMVFCDASDDLALRHGNVQLNGLLYSPTYGPSGFEMVDDLLAYFDATDDNLHYNTMRFSGSSECFDSSDHNFTGEVNCGYCPTSEATAEVPDLYVVGGASSSGSPIDDNQPKVNYEDVTDTNVAGGASSSGSSVAYNLTKVKYEDVNVTSDVQMNNVNDKTVGNRLVNMLGSISAPPAFAAEFPTGSGKSMAQISAATHSPSSIHVTAGFIHICGLPMSESAGLWSLRKNGNAGFILSYSTADDVVRKVAAPEPVMKNQVDAVSMMLRGGLYIFFLSALILTISYKVGMSIYGRAGGFMR